MTALLSQLALPALGAIAALLAIACDSPPAPARGEEGVKSTTRIVEAKPAPPPAPADPKVVDWLDKLEARGKDLRSIAGDVVWDTDNELIDRQVRLGKAVYLAPREPDQPSARFVIDFDRLVIDDAAHAQRKQIIFDGSWLVEKDHDRKLFLKRQIVAPGKVFNPLDLNGPFPLPIGQKRDDVLRQFEVTLEADDAELAEQLKLTEPALRLRLTPREGVARPNGAKDVESIQLWFDRVRLVPVRVVTKEPAKTTTLTLRNVKVDDEAVAVDEKAFDVTPPGPGEGWRVEVTPWGQ